MNTGRQWKMTFVNLLIIHVSNGNRFISIAQRTTIPSYKLWDFFPSKLVIALRDSSICERSLHIAPPWNMEQYNIVSSHWGPQWPVSTNEWVLMEWKPGLPPSLPGVWIESLPNSFDRGWRGTVYHRLRQRPLVYRAVDSVTNNIVRN